MIKRDWRNLSAGDALISMLLAYGLIWGVVTVSGKGERWSGPAFGVAREMVGGPASWGAALASFSVIGLVGFVAGSQTITQAGLVMCVLWSAAFAYALFAAASSNPQATWTGVVTWSFHGLLFLAAARRARW